MLREDLIENITETYPAPDPAGAEPTAFLHCTRGPVAWEPEGARRARDERIAGTVLARGLALCIAPSFVQLFAMLGEPWFAFVAVLLFLSFGTGFARTFLDEWPLRPGLALALLAAVHLLFIQVTAWGDQEAGYLMVLLPALLGFNWFGISLAREFALWTTNRLPLDEREATRLRDACNRLAVPDVGVVTAAAISFAVLTLGDPLLAVLALTAALAFFAGGDAGHAAANEGIVRFFSYNDHECCSPFVFQFGEPFRTPAARRAIFSALTSALGCGLAAAANRPPAITPSLLYDAFCAPSPRSDAAWGALLAEALGWVLRTAFIAAAAYPVLTLSIAASGRRALVPANRLLQEDR
jgi:hypothetical protein